MWTPISRQMDRLLTTEIGRIPKCEILHTKRRLVSFFPQRIQDALTRFGAEFRGFGDGSFRKGLPHLTRCLAEEFDLSLEPATVATDPNMNPECEPFGKR